VKSRKGVNEEERKEEKRNEARRGERKVVEVHKCRYCLLRRKES